MGLKIAVLGAGNIGGALIGGIVKSHLAEPQDVVATDAREDRRRELEAQWKIQTLPTAENRKAAKGRDIVILAVKPLVVPAVLSAIRGAVRENQIVISVAAGVPISFIESVLGQRIPIFRAMPNIPVVIDEGATAVAGNAATTPAQREIVEKIFGALGVVASVGACVTTAVGVAFEPLLPPQAAKTRAQSARTKLRRGIVPKITRSPAFRSGLDSSAGVPCLRRFRGFCSEGASPPGFFPRGPPPALRAFERFLYRGITGRGAGSVSAASCRASYSSLASFLST